MVQVQPDVCLITREDTLMAHEISSWTHLTLLSVLFCLFNNLAPKNWEIFPNSPDVLLPLRNWSIC